MNNNNYVMTKERCMELLNNVINHESAGRNCKETIQHLLYLGFTETELHHQFSFSTVDIADAVADMDEYEED